MTLHVRPFRWGRVTIWMVSMLLGGPTLGVDAQAIDGVLVDTRTGRGVPEARVALFDTLGVEYDVTRTGPDGRFVLRADGEGTFQISVHRPGYADRLSELIRLNQRETVAYRMDLTPLSSDQVESIQTTLAENARIRQVMVETCHGRMDPTKAGVVLGVVRDRAGDLGVGGARVVLSPPGGEALVAVTDRLGGYVFCAVPPGTDHPLRVTADGWASAIQGVDVLAGVISWYDFRLRPGDARR